MQDWLKYFHGLCYQFPCIVLLWCWWQVPFQDWILVFELSLGWSMAREPRFPVGFDVQHKSGIWNLLLFLFEPSPGDSCLLLLVWINSTQVICKTDWHTFQDTPVGEEDFCFVLYRQEYWFPTANWLQGLSQQLLRLSFCPQRKLCQWSLVCYHFERLNDARTRWLRCLQFLRECR